MAEVAPVATPAADPLGVQISAAQAAVAAAIAQLAIFEVDAALDPTAANLAAVSALQQRVAQKEAALAALYAIQAAQPPPTPSSGGVGGGGIPGINAPAPSLPPGLAGWNAPPKFPITGIVEGVGAAEAAGAWGTFLDETEGLVEINTSLDAIAAASLEAGTAITLAEVGGGIVAAIADLPEIAVAGGMVIIFYIVGKIMVFIGKHFPNPSLFGWHPLNFILKGVQDMGQAMVDTAQLVMRPIVALLLTPIHLIESLFQRTTNTIAGAHNKTTTLHNVTIPQAQRDAVATSNNYTDTELIALRDNLTTAIDKLRTDTTNAIADVRTAAINDTKSEFAALDTQLLAKLAGDEATVATLASEIQTTLPAEIQTAVNDAKAAEQQQLNATAANLQSQITSLNQQIATAQAGIASAVQTITSAESTLAQLEANGVTTGAEIQALQTTITTATDDYNQLVQTVTDLNNQITGISQTLGTVQSAQQLTTTTDNTITALGATGLVAVVAAIATKLTSLSNYVDTCVVQTCDETKPTGLKPSLLALLALLTDAAEIAAIAAMVKDPVGSADALAPTLDTIATGAIDTWDALLSL